MKARPTQSREGVKGGDFVPFRLPLAGSRDSVPCGVWGNAPTVPRVTSILNALNKGAGSEASLPVTLRVRRRAPKLLFPPRFREEPNKTASSPMISGLEAVFALSFFGQHRRTAHGLVQPQFDILPHQAVRRHHLRRIHPSGGTRRQHRSQPVYLRR